MDCGEGERRSGWWPRGKGRRRGGCSRHGGASRAQLSWEERSAPSSMSQAPGPEPPRGAQPRLAAKQEGENRGGNPEGDPRCASRGVTLPCPPPPPTPVHLGSWHLTSTGAIWQLDAHDRPRAGGSGSGYWLFQNFHEEDRVRTGFCKTTGEVGGRWWGQAGGPGSPCPVKGNALETAISAPEGPSRKRAGAGVAEGGCGAEATATGGADSQPPSLSSVPCQCLPVPNTPGEAGQHPGAQSKSEKGWGARETGSGGLPSCPHLRKGRAHPFGKQKHETNQGQQDRQSERGPHSPPDKGTGCRGPARRSSTVSA